MRALPWLVADIGGTNMRLGRILNAGGPVQDVVRFDTPRTGDLAPALLPYLDRFPEGRPRTAALAVAGPIVDGHVQLTNSGANLTISSAEREVGLDQIVLVNDLEAVAAALPRLAGSAVRDLGSDASSGLDTPARATRVVLGCGTGCGVGASIWGGDHWHVFASEGGHLPFPASSSRDRRWHDRVVAGLPAAALGRVTYDRVLCGSGLLALGEVIAAEQGAAAHPTPEALAAAAGAGDPVGVESTRHFAAWVNSFAGDLAQIFLARGGVYLAGSLLEGLAAFLAAPQARQCFTAKWPHDPLLEAVPLRLIIDPRAPLTGLGEILARPVSSS